ncbi:MAG: HAD family phosphatase [Vicinamibacterales bacterium]
MTRALQAVIFDFDGVIANSEPLHLRAFQQVLGEVGILLTAEEYYARYLGFDDVGAFQAVGQDRGVTMSAALVQSLVNQKGEKLHQILEAGDVMFRGAADFIRTAAQAVPIAIASGALRHEIDDIVSAAGLAPLFETIVASGDTPESKPSPAPYQLAFNRLKAVHPQLEAHRCVAIEDSRWGLVSAAGAGLRCVGVTTSYRADELGDAELIVEGLHRLTLSALDNLVAAVPGQDDIS